MSVALAAMATAAAASGPSERGGLGFAVAPEAPPSFGAVAGSPLLEIFVAAPADEIGWLSPAVFPPLASPGGAPNAALANGVEAPPPAGAADPPPVPTRSDSPPPNPAPTALAAALVRLIVRDGANPLGAGDWRVARAAIGAFYAERGFQPVWIDRNGLTTAGRAALARLANAAEDGLDLSGLALPRSLGANLGPDDIASAEVEMAAAVVAYAELASGSRIAPSRVSPLFASAPSVADPGSALAETAAARDPDGRLAAFNPPQKGYRDLREELRRLAELTPAARRRAALDLDFDAVNAPLAGGDSIFEADPLIDGRRGGKGARRSGLYSAAAQSALAGSLSRRRVAILANMEMWRWEPRDMGERRIEVNIPDYSVEVLDGDAVIHSARVIVGKAATPTPIFSDAMRYVLINPSWQVPDSIIKKEILPRLSHFESLGYEVKMVGGRIVVRQPPGDDNALGRLAFMFPNEHSVYLHDTPSQQLFSEEVRALSHGCVRVEEPLRLAELVLGWPESRVNAAIGGPERTVFLPRPVPIHIEYFTEFVDAYGMLQERPDVYGLTHRVAGILSATGQD